MASAPRPSPSHSAPIPPAVQRQRDNAERLQRESIGAPEPVADGAPPEPAVAPAPVVPAAPAPAPVPVTTVDKAEFDREVNRTRAEQERVANLSTQLAASNNMIADLQRQMNELQAKAAAPPTRYLTDEERADYGDGLVDVWGRRAREEVEPEINKLKGEIAGLKDTITAITGRVETVSEATFEQKLDAGLPGWRDQNRDQAFMQWLNGKIPYTETQYGERLGEAYRLKDVKTVIQIFQGYRDEAAASGDTSRTYSPAPAQNGKVPLESFATPGRATPTQATQVAPSVDVAQYTPEQIATFYKEKALGVKWKGREAEAAAIDADIIRANREGRIVSG